MAGEDLDAIAAAELIKDAKRGSERAEVMGAMGWRRCPLPTANKVFLNNTLLSIIGHSKRHEKGREKASKERRFSQISSSSGRESRKRTYSPHSHPQEQKISKTHKDDKDRDCISSDKKSDTKKEFLQRKHSYSSHFPSSYKGDKETKYKKKRIK